MFRTATSRCSEMDLLGPGRIKGREREEGGRLSGGWVRKNTAAADRGTLDFH